MKKYIKYISNLATGLVFLSLIATSCVDEIKFGSAFLEKAPGGSITKDTIFGNAEYTRQFLVNLYTYQYYGLPLNNADRIVYFESANSYVGKLDALTDCYIFTYNSGIKNGYNKGNLTAQHGIRTNRFDYLRNSVWEAIHNCYLLLENIDGVPGLSDEEKASMIAQTKCIIASRYFDVFRHYGGVPIIEKTFTGTDTSYDIPRNTVEETVNHIVKLLDEAAPILPWSVYDPDTETGRWTKAAAMAMKCKVLQFAASPLFNDKEPYYPGATEATVWYGGYKPELWQQCLKACQEFFTELKSKGFYELVQATGNRPEDYRLAYRLGYMTQGSREIIHSVRAAGTDNGKDSKNHFKYWTSIGRGYSPTHEYMVMFPWKDGTPFDWEKTKAEGKLDEMFMKGDPSKNPELTRDPRMYEEIIVNGQPAALNSVNGNMSGDPSESWLFGYNAGQNPNEQKGSYSTGYAPIKYVCGSDFIRKYTQWVTLRLSDLYLVYAEALLQANNDFQGALEQINIVRNRVGLGKIETYNPDKNLTSNKANLLEEILRERACELGMEDARFFDLLRYKRKDIFEKQIHGLVMHRLDENGNILNKSWKKDTPDSPYPTKFEYEIVKITKDDQSRIWWTQGFDPKWYLSPFPATEVNKGYGLTQNPGW